MGRGLPQHFAHPHDRGASGGELILLRHGESEWNRSQRFTGWENVALTDVGRQQMQRVGERLARAGHVPDVVFCSTLRRCRESLDELQTGGIRRCATTFDWRLNERHYGALTGRSKHEAVTLYGAEQVRAWRRSYSVIAPAASESEQARLFGEIQEGMPEAQELPRAESLAHVVARVQGCWMEAIAPQVHAGRRVLVLGHGNSLRALVMILESLTPERVVSLEVPNAEARVYRADDNGAGSAASSLTLQGRLSSGIATTSFIL